MHAQTGLAWKKTWLGYEPEWTKEPSIQAIEEIIRRQFNLLKDEPCTVKFLAEGAFTKYTLCIVQRMTTLCASLYRCTRTSRR